MEIYNEIPRYDWTLEELQALEALSLIKLVSYAHCIHTKIHQPDEVQMCNLVSIKTGGCPENCKYCPQSSHYQTLVKAQPLMQHEEVLREAKKAIERGATRVCLGAAWREVRDGKLFDDVLAIIKSVADLGVEVCCTLGMLKEHQAKKLKNAGLYAYNHNLDSSEKFYPTFVTTRTYQERLDTLDTVRQAGLSVCCGGIIGMGETMDDRLELLLTLSQRCPHPESVPINRLIPIPGTPLENQSSASAWEMIRMVAIARIVMPHSMIRLSAGRINRSFEEQALCFLAGANSIHIGEKLLTTGNQPFDKDLEMFRLLGIKPMASRQKEEQVEYAG